MVNQMQIRLTCVSIDCQGMTRPQCHHRGYYFSQTSVLVLHVSSCVHPCVPNCFLTPCLGLKCSVQPRTSLVTCARLKFPDTAPSSLRLMSFTLFETWYGHDHDLTEVPWASEPNRPHGHSIQGVVKYGVDPGRPRPSTTVAIHRHCFRP